MEPIPPPATGKPPPPTSLVRQTPPLPVVAAAFAGGILCAPWFAPSHGLLLAGLALAGLLFLRRARSHPERALPLSVILFFLLGIWRGSLALAPPAGPYHAGNLVPHKTLASVIGTLLEAPVTFAADDGPRSRLLIDLEALHLPPPGRPDLAGEAEGRILLTLKGVPPAGLQPGDTIVAQALLAPPRSATSPGSFDYQFFLAGQGIFLTGWVASPEALAVLRRASLAAGFSWLQQMYHLPEILRQRLGALLEKTSTQAGLYKAILIGERAGISAATLEHFKAAGCFHILAISGLHVGLVAAGLFAGWYWLLRRSTRLLVVFQAKKLAGLLTLPFLFFYALVAGFNPPVVRALLMTVAVMSALLFDRQRSLASAIALAALVLLVWQPAALFTAGFQLSFAAVIAIAVCQRPIAAVWEKRRQASSPATAGGPPFIQRLTGGVLTALLVSLAATGGTAPLLFYHFNRISLVGPLANLLVEPLICLLALPAGLAAAVLWPFFPELAVFLVRLGDLGLVGAALVCRWFAALPLASVWLPTPSVLEVFLLYLLIFLGFQKILPGPSVVPVRRPAMAILLALLAGLQLLPVAARRLQKTTRVTFLDVGSGNATLMELPGGALFLLDAGTRANSDFDPGERIIAPYLWQRKIYRLDGVIISHPHADHYNGLSFLLDRFQPAQLIVGENESDEPGYRRLLAQVETAGIPVRRPASGDTLYEGSGARLMVIGEPPADYRGKNAVNNNSLVLRLEHQGERGSASFLLPGDIETERERHLVASSADLDADVLLAPHHGAKGSSSEEFWRAVSPELVVVSAGHRDLSHLPGNVALYSTATHGTLVVTTDGAGTEVGPCR